MPEDTDKKEQTKPQGDLKDLPESEEELGNVKGGVVPPDSRPQSIRAQNIRPQNIGTAGPPDIKPQH